MAFKPPPAILQRVLRFKAMKYESNGGITLWGIPSVLSMHYALVYLQRLLEDKSGLKKASSFFYAQGALQARQGFRMISKRFGYAKSIPDKANLLRFNAGQAEMVGRGEYEWKAMDFDKGSFVITGHSTTADEYKRFFGTQSHSVDHFMRGAINSYIEESLGKKCFTAESKCLAMGHKYCEFITKPLKNWKGDSLFKEQAIEDMPTIEQMGSKILPYLSLV
jgi:predicted hydrocarbon binding protein